MTDKLLQSTIETAKRAIERRDFEAASDAVARLLERFPGEAASHGLELELMLAKGENVEAARSADRLAERFPSSAGVLYQAGIAAFRLKQYTPARARFEESDKLFPSLKSRRWLAKTLTNLGRFDDAEGLLLSLLEWEPDQRTDLAWLYERKGDQERARENATRHLERYPNDKRAQNQILRLSAETLDESEVIEQVELLDALGEAIPDSLVPRYVKALVATGRSDDARHYIDETRPHLGPRVITDLAWKCHRLQLHDKAFELFILVVADNLQYVKLLNTLNFCAKRSGRVEELVELYESMAPQNPNLYGHIKRLRKAENAK